MRYLITGGSGYIGTRLVESLAARAETEQVVNLDIHPPVRASQKSIFVQSDVRDHAELRNILERHEIDWLIHLAFIVNPLHDEALMYDIDVNGTKAVLRAVSEAGTRHALVASSVMAYGAFPDNPRPIYEDWPVRGMPGFSYARHKSEVDLVCQRWAAEHSNRLLTIVRPCIVFGPNVDNYIVRRFREPFWPVPDGVEEQLQLIHEDDLVRGLETLIDGQYSGVFNIAGDDTMGWREAAAAVGLKPRVMPFRLVYLMEKLRWTFRLNEAPPGNLDVLRFPWVVSSEKLKEATGWKPRYTTRETFEITMRSRGWLRQEKPSTPGP